PPSSSPSVSTFLSSLNFAFMNLALAETVRTFSSTLPFSPSLPLMKTRTVILFSSSLVTVPKNSSPVAMATASSTTTPEPTNLYMTPPRCGPLRQNPSCPDPVPGPRVTRGLQPRTTDAGDESPLTIGHHMSSCGGWSANRNASADQHLIEPRLL